MVLYTFVALVFVATDFALDQTVPSAMYDKRSRNRSSLFPVAEAFHDFVDYF